MLERVRIRYTVVLSRFAGRQAGEARTAVDDYRFIDRWRVHGTLDDIWEIMTDGAAFKRWWPGNYLDARETAAGDEDGLGKTIAFHAQGGRLLYTLRWQARTIRLNKP